SRRRARRAIASRYAKLPLRTSSQSTAVLQAVQRVVEKAVLPLERAVNHWPVPLARPVMSDLPSPLKSPTWTWAQVTPVLQVVQRVVLNAEPALRPVHQAPFESTRPVMSDLPSPLKSPTFTSTQLTRVDQVSHSLLTKDEPVD